MRLGRKFTRILLSVNGLYLATERGICAFNSIKRHGNLVYSFPRPRSQICFVSLKRANKPLSYFCTNNLNFQFMLNRQTKIEFKFKFKPEQCSLKLWGQFSNFKSHFNIYSRQFCPYTEQDQAAAFHSWLYSVHYHGSLMQVEVELKIARKQFRAATSVAPGCEMHGAFRNRKRLLI